MSADQTRGLTHVIQVELLTYPPSTVRLTRIGQVVLELDHHFGNRVVKHRVGQIGLICFSFVRSSSHAESLAHANIARRLSMGQLHQLPIVQLDSHSACAP